MKSLILALIIFFLSLINAQAQVPANLATGMTSVLHPTPNAASLGKFTEIPVSLHTGIPSIAVPLWQIQRGDIAVDIGLAYHAGGIKVDEAASWVGLGWALEAGGMITRSARGLPDNLDSYGVNELPLIHRYLGLASPVMSDTERRNYVLNVVGGVVDAEPDLYSLSVGGISCQFFMNKDGNFVTTSRSLSLRIQYNALDVHKKRYTWLVTDGKGVQYKFNSAEHTTTTVYNVGKQGTSATDGSSFDGDVSWGLNEIEDLKGNIVDFTYTKDANYFTNIANEHVTVVLASGDSRCAGKEDHGYTYVENQGSALRLTSITCGQEEVRFTAATTERQDMAYAHALTQVTLYYAGIPKRAFRLFSSYFSGTPTGTRGVYYADVHNAYRLRLDSLREESANGVLVKPAYRFAYIPGELPYRGSAAQDYWGYYNGQDNRSRISYTMSGNRLGADKNPNPAYTAIGTLSAIRYPTGGSINFTYEANRYPRNKASFGTPIQVDSTFAHLIVSTTLGLINPNTNDYYYGFPDEQTPAVQKFVVTPAMGTLDVHLRLDLTVDNQPVLQQSGFTQYALIRAVGANQAVTYQFQPNQGFVAHLLPGEYQLEVYIEKDYNYLIDKRTITMDASVTATVTNTPYVAGQEALGPGLRIKQVRKIFAPGTEETRSYEYTDPVTGQSSAELGGLPDYQRDQSVTFISNPGGNATIPYHCDCQTFTSNSHYPLIDTRGSYTGYSYVSEYFDLGKTQGRKTYTYTNYLQFNDLNAQLAFPYPPASPQGWKRGLPLVEQTYAGVANSTAVRRILADSTTYDSPIASLDWSYGLKMSNAAAVGDLTSADDAKVLPDLYYNTSIFTYRLETDSYQTQTKTTTQVTPTGSLQTTAAYEYTPDTYQVNRITSTGSDAATTVQRFFFPTDYRAGLGNSSLLAGLLAANRLTVPVEQTTLRMTGTTTRLVAGVAHEYSFLTDLDGSQRLYLKKIYEANTTLADPTRQYDFQTLPAHYEEKSYTQKVTSHSQPLVQRDRQAPVSAYQWGYEDRYPLAICTNATDREFFYEGFEESATATTGPAHTGIKYASTTYTINWTKPNARPYYLSYWYRANNSWKYQRVLYSGPTVLLTGGDAYDDVCIWPQDAQLTTYTYEPLIGMTSQTTPSGRTTTYEYDGLGRLIRTRDEQGRILSQQQYHYAGK